VEKRIRWVYGHTTWWAPMTLDAERGLLYMPVSTPSNDFYGGRRHGANLFADSLVCLDAATGKRNGTTSSSTMALGLRMPSPPNLVTITVDGRRIDAVLAADQMGFAFVFDRVTGKPVWPIDERAFPRATCPAKSRGLRSRSRRSLLHSKNTESRSTMPRPDARTQAEAQRR